MAQFNDEDCDGVLSQDDCDDNNPLSVLDMDCDGYSSNDDCNDFDPSDVAFLGDCDQDSVPTGLDCDDTDPLVLHIVEVVL